MHLWMQQRIFDGFENIDSEQQETGNSEGRCKRLRLLGPKPTPQY